MTLQEILAKAKSYQDSGCQEAAEHLYRAVIALDAYNPEANHNLGVALVASGSAEAGLTHLQTAVENSPQTLIYRVSLVRVLMSLDRQRDALIAIDQASSHGVASEEISALKNTIIYDSSKLENGDFSRLVESKPSVDGMKDQLLDLLRRGKLLQARILARKLTEKSSDDGFAWKVLGTLLVRDGRYPAALEVLETARRLTPADAEVLNSLARAYRGLDQFDKALEMYRDALDLEPASAEIWNNQGLVQQHMGFMEEALQSYARAVNLQPNYAKAHSNRGLLLKELDRSEEALEACSNVLRIQSDDLDALNLKGLVLQDLGHLDAAADCFESILAVQPKNTFALTNRGNVFKDQGFIAEALGYYRQALDVQPEMLQARQNLLFCLNYQSDISREKIFAEHCQFERYQGSRIQQLASIASVAEDADRQLRIGFVSGDFRQHSVASFLLPVLEHIDRRNFQIFCYITSLKRDEITKIFRRLADIWVEASGLSAAALGDRVRSDQIDLLFDLSGHSEGNAILAFAAKPAPVQISWIGYPNTTGLNAIDYRLVDEMTDPIGEADAFHSECLIRLPQGFLCYRPWNTGASLSVSGLPCLDIGRITFGSFNNIAKLTPDTLDLWGNVLRALPDSRLVLKSHSVRDTRFWDYMLGRLTERGVDSHRVKILPRAPSYLEHLSQYREIDIALDTYPYQGTTTTCEALFMGVPVVTLAGDRHAGRVGVSLMNQVGLPSLIANSADDYVRIAVSLATDRERLSELRMTMRARFESSSLCDELGFTRMFEQVLRQMWRIWCAGDSPRVFEVEDAHNVPNNIPSVLSPLKTKPPEKLKKKRKKKQVRRKGGGLSALRRLKNELVLRDAPNDGLTTNDCASVLRLFKDGRYSEAEQSARRLTERYPSSMFGWKALGTILVKIERNEAAIPYLLEAIRLCPEEDESIHNLGYALLNLSRFEEAIGCFKRAIEINPDYVEAHINLGTSYKDTNRFDEAMKCYDKALDLNPENPEVHCNRGVALDELGRLGEAVDSQIRALELLPIYPQAHNNLGNVYKNIGLLDDAVSCYRKALESQPDLKAAYSNLLLCLNYDSSISPARIFAEHQAFEQQLASQVVPLPPLSTRNKDPGRVLRLGLVSGDLRLHSVTFFLLPVLENLSRDQFQVFCYSKSHRRDDVTQALQQASYAWFECSGLSDQELAERIRADEIDLLMDLNGHTSPNALLAFAARPAPVQITWIGYPNTTGLKAMDYRIVDGITDPVSEADAFHSEKLIRLPRGFLCYRPWTSGEDLPVGLPPCLERNRVTFGSFNNLAKITNTTLDLWGGVMKAVPDARLLLKTHTASDIDVWNRLVAYLADQGIATDRVEMLPRAPSYMEHLVQYQRLDIALDAFPYHGTTTTCEALFMGVPVVSLMGDRHASRVGGSLLTHAGLPELIAESTEDYIRIARDLARDPESLKKMRAGLRDRLATHPLRDEIGFTRELEQALRQMWRIWCEGDPPRLFEVGDETVTYRHNSEQRNLDGSYPENPASGDESVVSDSPLTRHDEKRARKKKHSKKLTNGSRESADIVLSDDGARLKKHKPLSPSLSEEDAVIRLFNQGCYVEAEIAAHQLVNLYPRAMFGWKILGTTLVKLNRHEDALPHLLAANRLAPGDAECINALGSALQHLGRLSEALGCFQRVLDIDPRFVLAYANMGAALSDLGRFDEALNCYDQALLINQDSAEVHANRSLTLYRMGRFEDALASFDHLLNIRPDDVDALNKRGILLQNCGRFREALASFDAALVVKPESADALTNRGNVFKDQGDLETASSCYRQAMGIQPNLIEAWHNRLLCLNYQDAVSRDQVYAEHLSFDRHQASSVFRLPPSSAIDRNPERCLRIGLVSSDFRHHSVAFFILPILERLDRRVCQTYCYMTSLRQDEVTVTFRKLADVWVECAGLGARALANRIRADRIDILIDLSGHTDGNFLLTFAARPSPVQITWVGYPNTTGLQAMDYRLVDEVTDPVGDADVYHSERLIRLPQGFLCYRPLDSAFTLDVGPLPCRERGQITFGSFNNLAKVSSTTLRLWCDLLLAVPNARLVLKTPTTTEGHVWGRVVAYFIEHGIDRERLETLPRASGYLKHLASYRVIDIALDTYPYNGTTTTCEALFMGVPVITLLGDRHVARVGASLLTRVGLTDLIAGSEEEYIRISKDLSGDKDRLCALRADLRRRVEQSPLRDELTFTRTLEVAFRQMWRIFCQGDQPRVFEVSARGR
ncbi:Tetratricopeptide TPR_2 repeat-containing protein [Thiorhodococcus drewsii AZ1]|uniref:protein O-GlcNAc transferase n=1 Tax=Thiorhodococcus drewsii AZ1 TaxID=765913 RepID=G2E377_9GAMM|nr:tetratricopeptide repeat protein [Thiorhodococcus drewsii]EGV30539.1 Tetratricopeptide TPR_2 repeat-containing protein [Thiorhodococcus drewsii AZ1]